MQKFPPSCSFCLTARTACALFGALGFLLGPAGAQETASAAVSAFRAERGAAPLGQLAEMRGARGEPMPKSWTLLFNDPDARGGIREIVVKNGAVVSERTPVRNLGGAGDFPPLPLAKINLDTNAVFRAANRAAIRRNVGFHWIDYTLRTDRNTRRPVWSVELTDYLGARIGDILLDAETLAEVRPLILSPTAAAEIPPPAQPDRSRRIFRGGVLGSAEQFLRRAERSVKKGFYSAAGSVQEWLVGERTIGIEEE